MNTSHAADAYPDLLESDSDGSLAKVVIDLATIYRLEAAPTSLRKTIDSALSDAVRHTARKGPLASGNPRRFRLGAGALVAAALVVVVGVVGYAVAPIIDRLLTTESGVAALPMRDIGIAQTAAGVTVRVDRAYADANRVIVAYTIQVPPRFAHSTSGIDGKATLTDSSGRSLPFIDAQGMDGNNPQVSAGLVTFDAESLPQGISTDKFQFALTDVRAQPVVGGTELAAGAFSIKFELPVAAGRQTNVAKTVVANGVPVTLERLVVTPSETRVYLRFPAGGGINAADWNANAHLSGDGWDSRQTKLPVDRSVLMTTGAYFMNGQGEHVTTFSGDFRSRHGAWTLTVDLLWAVDSSAPATAGGNPKQSRKQGPWTFHLTPP